MTATIPVGPRTVIWLETQGRMFHDAGRLGQALVRPAVGLKLDPTTTLFAGYAHVLYPAKRQEQHARTSRLAAGFVPGGRAMGAALP